MKRSTGLLAVIALLALPACAQAADATVTRTDDPVEDGCATNGCSLREAVALAQTGGGHTVTIPASATAYEVTQADIDVAGPATLLGAGAGTTTITGDADNRIFNINGAGGVLTIERLTLTGGHDTGGTGGAINAEFGTLIVRDSVITGNDTIVSGNNAQGGGIRIGAAANGTIERTAITNNLAKSTTNAANGGGIHAQGSLTLTDSTVSDNKAETTFAAVSASVRGAGINGLNDITVTDSTITGNIGTASSSAATLGGGISIQGSGSLLTLVGSTVTANQAQGNANSQGGNIYANSSAAVQPGRSIIAGGVAVFAGRENCRVESPATVATQGFNLEDLNQCGLGAGELHDTNPLLGTLGAFGGGTSTQPIGALSPARDGGGACGDPADQRGFPRVGPCDIGAYERQAPTVTASGDRATALTGEAVGFSASATDSDPGDTVSAVSWTFDDGATASGATASHAFATPGRHTATATVTDPAGVSGGATVTVDVSVPAVAGPAPDRTLPGLTGLAFVPAAFPAATSGASVRSARARPPARRPRVTGSKVSYRLTEAARVTFTVERATAGRLVNRRCVKPTRANRTRPRCTRFVAVAGSFSHAGKAGANSFRFTGRVGGRKLAAGSYRLVAIARDAAGNRSQVVRKAFRVIP